MTANWAGDATHQNKVSVKKNANLNYMEPGEYRDVPKRWLRIDLLLARLPCITTFHNLRSCRGIKFLKTLFLSQIRRKNILTSQKFSVRPRFPNVVGALYGTNIPIMDQQHSGIPTSVGRGFPAMHL